jgi:hypothetical protein
MMDKWGRLAQRVQANLPPPPQPRDPPQYPSKEEREVSRIVGLPVYSGRQWDDQRFRKKAGLTLRPVQRQALASIADAGGGLLPIGVGHGKTFIGLLAGAALDASLVILLVPPRTVPQTYEALARVDSHYVVPKVEVVSYSRLSQADSSDLLRRLAEGHSPARIVLVADEAHNLKNFSAARTKRVARFLSEYKGVRFVAMSGTLTTRSIKDFAHLADWALQAGSPVPRPSAPQGMVALDHWAQCIDVTGRPSQQDWAWCVPLWNWAGQQYLMNTVPTAQRRTLLQQSLYKRIKETKGVTITDQSSFGGSLYLVQQGLDIPDVLRQTMAQVERTKCRPDGVPLDSTTEQWRVLRQLSLGFYYRWVWKDGVDAEWLEARSEWARQVRTQLDHHSEEGYDSPLLVYNRTAREFAAGQRRAIHRAWQAWERVKDRPAPPVEAVWVTDDVLDKCFASVQNGQATLIWYADQAVADWLARRGVAVVEAGQPVPSKVQTYALSIRSHGTGLNLQDWSHNLVLSPSGSGQEWEQLIGRTHRPGQTQDEVWVTVLAHTAAFRQALSDAMANAEYLQHTTGQPQKLLLATQL